MAYSFLHQPEPFEDLLPVSSDPVKSQIRGKLVYILNSKGEILPPADSPMGKLWHLVNSPQSSVADCEEVIKLDSVLASRIFRVANSAAYGVKANNISEAIFRIGFTCVREQVFNSGVFAQFSNWDLPPEWSLFWQRNIFIARLCERICNSYFATDGSEYLAGLIHNIGLLFLVTYFPNEVQNITASKKPLEEAEKEFLPFDHATISGAIGTRSMLPLRAVNAILYHHNPMGTAVAESLEPDQIEPVKSPRFLAIVLSLCDQVADSCQMDPFGRSTITLEQILAGPELRWLENFGGTRNLTTLVEEELDKSREIFNVFFSNNSEQDLVEN